MLLNEFVQQHRVDRLIAHGIDVPLLITGNQVWVDLFNLLGHKSELRDANGIQASFLPEPQLRLIFYIQWTAAILLPGLDSPMKQDRLVAS